MGHYSCSCARGFRFLLCRGVALLIDQAEAALRKGDLSGAVALSIDAKILNDVLPDTSMVSSLYHLLVKIAILKGDNAEAKALSTEGLSRKSCRDTYLAAALACESSGNPAAASFQSLANSARE